MCTEVWELRGGGVKGRYSMEAWREKAWVAGEQGLSVEGLEFMRLL